MQQTHIPDTYIKSVKMYYDYYVSVCPWARSICKKKQKRIVNVISNIWEHVLELYMYLDTR